MNDKEKEKEKVKPKVISPNDEEPTLDDIRLFAPPADIEKSEGKSLKKKGTKES